MRDGFEGGIEIRVGLHTVHLGGLDERGDTPPRRRPLIVTGEQRILASQGQRPDGIFHRVGVGLDPCVAQKHPKSVPLPVDVGELLAQA